MIKTGITDMLAVVVSFSIFLQALGTPDHFGTSTFTSVLSYNSSNALCATDPPIGSSPANDLGKCSWNCIVRKLCENFNYHNDTKQCDIYFDKPRSLRFGQSCTHYQLLKRKHRDCDDLLADGFDRSGVYVIYPDAQQQNKVTVYCDMDTSPGRAWTVFARSTDNALSFNVSASFFASGFGNPTSEFWLGNEILHILTSQRRVALRIDMIDTYGTKCHAYYSNFSVGSSSSNYQLNISGSSENCSTAVSATTVSAEDINLAYRQPAYRSSVYNAYTTPDKAVDGNKDGNFNDGSCVVVADDQSPNSWFVVDLGTPVVVLYVKVYNRVDDCSERLDNFIVGLTNTFNGTVTRDSYPVCGQYPQSTFGFIEMTVYCKQYTPAGRYVIIQTPVGTPGPLTICEVEVYGRGTHIGVSEINWAHGKPTFQSSTHISAGYAVDGYADVTSVAYFSLHCTHTQTDADLWLVVDLETIVTVSHVAVTNRGDCCGERLSGFIVGVSSFFNGTLERGSYPICGQYPGTTANGARLVVICDVATPPGRYVSIQLPANNPGPLTVCELEVYSKGDIMLASNGMEFSTFDSDHDNSSLNCASILQSGFWLNCDNGGSAPIGPNKAWNSNLLEFSEMKILPTE